jgi:hypothetical protein
MMKMTDLERAVLTKFLDGDHPVLNSLRRQLETCSVSTRELTGVGFYANLVADASVAPRVESDFIFSDVVAQQVDGLQHGACFVLYVESGVLKMLEGCSYDEPWPEQISGFQLSYRNRKGEGGMSNERDWQALAKILDAKRGNL